ncbi:MAG: TIR domain-containing protein [Xanthobacteraceae bacterium]
MLMCGIDFRAGAVVEYDAFISYSHAQDKPIASALQAVLQKLGKSWYRRRALRVFRDDSSLAASPQLWATIEQALRQSRFLILLASPDAALSPWVEKEVNYWTAHKSPDTLLLGVTEGDLTWDSAAGRFKHPDGTPLPPGLVGAFCSEPKWVDLRPYRMRGSKRDPQFRHLAAAFAASIHGIPKEDLMSQEVRQQRRALVLGCSAAISLLMLAGVAGWQSHMRNNAVSFAVAKESEANRQRELTLQTTIYGRRYTTEQLLLVADWMLNTGNPSMEDQAVLYFREALADMRRLAAEYPDRNDLKEGVARSLGFLGNALNVKLDVLGATKAHSEAVGILRQLVDEVPPTTELRVSLARALNNLGSVLQTVAQLHRVGMTAGLPAASEPQAFWDRALPFYNEALQLLQGLTADAPDNEEWLPDLSTTLLHIGEVLLESGDHEAALERYGRSVAIREQLADAHPTDTALQLTLAASYKKVAELMLKTGQHQAAARQYRKGVEITEKVALADSADTDFQQGVASSYEGLADMLLESRQVDAAVTEYRRSLSILNRLVRAYPANSRWHSHASEVQAKIAAVFATIGRREEALKAYYTSFSMRDKLAAMLAARREYTEAIAEYREALTIAEKPLALEARDANWWRRLSLTHRRLGDLVILIRQPEEARAEYQRSFAIAQLLAAAEPKSAQHQREVAHALRGISTAGSGQDAATVFETHLRSLKLSADGWVSQDNNRTAVRRITNN